MMLIDFKILLKYATHAKINKIKIQVFVINSHILKFVIFLREPPEMLSSAITCSGPNSNLEIFPTYATAKNDNPRY